MRFGMVSRTEVKIADRIFTSVASADDSGEF